ncbi:MAG: InlB B-repeat-containing protein, partial [Oscillospiraceae bacterium]|nr:InlB B-repeat-containing protein [Oscillospiraceae bacterium]
MKRNLKQLLSLLIVLAMVFSMIPSAFAADGDPATVSYVANGVAYDTVATTEGGTVVLPTLGAAPEGYTFAGWTTAEIVETTDAPAYYGGGASYAVPGDVTLYAVYSRFEEGSGGSSEYTLVTDASQLVLGVNVVIAAANADYALSTTQNGNNRASTAVTKVGDTLSITESVAELTLEAGTVPGTYAFYTGDGYLYAASSSANHLKTQATMSANASFTLTPDGSGVTSAVANGSYTRNNLRFNATNNPPLFSCYEAGKQTDIALYVKGAGGTTYYATNVVEECVHNIVNVAAVAPTCTEAGSTAGSYCDICEVVFVAVAPIAAAGHDYVGEETLAPTTTEDGVMTYTCTVCSDSYPVTIPALGEEYTVSFSVPAGVTQEAMSGYANDVIELPTPTGAPDSNAKAYVFAGWVAASVDNSDVKPEILAVGSDYLIEGNVTLYALYSYEEGGSGVTAYTLVTDAAQLSAGATVVIAAAAADYAMSTTQNSNNRGSVAVTKVDNVLSITEGVAELTLEDGTVAGTYAFYTGEGYLYAASSSSNHMRTQATINDNASFALTVDVSGVTVAIASGSNTNNNLRFNSSNNPPLFSCYASTSTMAAIALYVKDSGGTNYYTTVLDESCEHVPVERPAVAATCTEPGLTAGSYCSVCDLTLVEQTIVVPLGHDHQESDRLDPTETEAGYIEYTCPRCGNSYEVVLDPLGAPITVSFVVPEGVDAQAAAVGYAGQTTALPTPTGVPADTAQEYVFAGWTTTALEDTETRPTILPADYSYEFASDATLYALYTYSSGGSGSGDYVKVTEAPADWSGNYVIVYEAGSLILDGSLSSLDVASNYRTVTITEGVIAAAEADAYSFAVAAVEGGYSIKSAYGHFIGKASASGNSINTSTSTAYVNTLALEDGNAVITSSTMIMRYNSTNGQTRFRYYGSGQQPVALYLKQGTIGSTFYTTLPAEPAPCEHVNTTLTGAVAATCTEAGYTGDLVCDDCAAIVTAGSVIAATGHTEVDIPAVAATCTEAGSSAGSYCSVCSEVLEAVTAVPATGHTEVEIPAVAATCTEAGSTAGSYCSVCSDVLVAVTAVPATGHTEVAIPAVAATCTEAGSTAGSYCSVCSEVLVAVTATPATGHTYTYVNNGDDHTVGCADCDYSATEAHSYEDGVCVCGA